MARKTTYPKPNAPFDFHSLYSGIHPGYAAYALSKTATCALADTLRQEALLYKSQQKIRVHCSFPGTFHSEQFTEGQIKKPALLKEFEGANKKDCGLTAAKKLVC
jgi:3-dehydrosphinganine reductase